MPLIFSLETLRRRIPGATRAITRWGRRFNQQGFATAVKIQKVKADFVAVGALQR